MALSEDSARLGATTDRVLNKLAFAIANKASDIGTATTSDVFLMFDASADYEAKYGYGANVLEAAGVTATAAELNAAAAAGSRVVSVPDDTTYSVLAADSGKIHIIPDLTGDCTFSLPEASAGLEYRFIYAGVAADAQDWIIDAGDDTNFYLGGFVHLDTDSDAAGDEVVPAAGDGDSNSIVTVLTPAPGTDIHLVCDGTNWILSGSVVSATIPSFADQA